MATGSASQLYTLEFHLLSENLDVSTPFLYVVAFYMPLIILPAKISCHPTRLVLKFTVW